MAVIKRSLIKISLTVVMSLFCFMSYFNNVYADQIESVSSINQREMDLDKNTKELVEKGKYFEEARLIMNLINDSDFLPFDKYEHLYSMANKALSADTGEQIQRDTILTEKRNILIFLLGAPIKTIEDKKLFSKLRSQYSSLMVNFIVNLKNQKISEYKQKTVYLNMPEEFHVDAHSQQDQYNSFLDVNNKNNESNKYQKALLREIKFLEPKVRFFLETNFLEPPSNHEELIQLMELLNKAG